MNHFRSLIIFIAACCLAACGSDGTEAVPVQQVRALQFVGTAAADTALTEAAVSIRCASGQAQTTTAADGSFAVSLPSGVLPCMVQVTGGGRAYRSVVVGSGPGTYRVNASPLTELVVARMAGAGTTAAAYFAAFGAGNTAIITAASLNEILAYLRTALFGLADFAGFNPLSDLLVASSSGSSANELGNRITAFVARTAAEQIALDRLSLLLAGTQAAAPLTPTITVPPVAAAVIASQTAEFSVGIASELLASYQWQVSIDGGVVFIDVAGATGVRYTLTTQVTDTGKVFRVRVSSAAGTVLSAPATLQVAAATMAPVIAVQPANQTVTAPATASFAVAANGAPAPAYQWQRSTDGGATFAFVAGANAASYTTPATGVADNGTRWRVVVSNIAGTMTSAAAVLSVNFPEALSPPQIPAQPQNITVTYGQSASFSITGASTLPLSYQWSRNGTPISGATAAIYTIATTVAGDNGAVFTVAVTNSNGSTASAPATLTVTGIPTAPRSMAAGPSHSVTVQADGSVMSWGNIKGDIGTSLSGLMGVGSDAVAAGMHTVAKNANGSLFTGAQMVAAGQWSTLVLKTDGTVWGWGYAGWGNLGNSANYAFEQKSPVQARLADGSPLTGVTRVAMGIYATSMAVTSDGSVFGWGQNRYGHLGIGSSSESGQMLAVPMLSPTGVGRFTDAVQAVAGISSSAVLKRDGTVYTMGWAGPLGNGSNVNRTLPARVETAPGVALGNVQSIAAGGHFYVAVTTAGTAYAWGANGSGQLGDGTQISRDRAVAVRDASGNPITGIVAAYAGVDYTVFLKSDGTVWSTGNNDIGQLGVNSTVAWLSIPTLVKDAAGGPFNNVVGIALLDSHVLARRSDGSIWSWGSNVYLQVGDMTTVNRRNPIRVQ